MSLFVALFLVLLTYIIAVPIWYICMAAMGYFARVWRVITKPAAPPWRRYGLERNHVSTKDNPRNLMHQRLMVTP